MVVRLEKFRWWREKMKNETKENLKLVQHLKKKKQGISYLQSCALDIIFANNTYVKSIHFICHFDTHFEVDYLLSYYIGISWGDRDKQKVRIHATINFYLLLLG